MEKVEGVIEDATMGATSTGQNRYAFTIAGKKYSTFDDKLGNEFMQKKGKIVTLEYTDTTKGEYTYHNITNMVDSFPGSKIGDNFEPEKVAKSVDSWDRKQILIVRQNSLTNANLLIKNGIELGTITKENIKELGILGFIKSTAQELESWVMRE